MKSQDFREKTLSRSNGYMRSKESVEWWNPANTVMIQRVLHLLQLAWIILSELKSLRDNPNSGHP